MICLHVFAPLPKVLGLTNTLKATSLELSIEPQATLTDLFCQLADRYPAFESLANPNPDAKLSSIIVSLDGEIIPRTDYAQTVIPQDAEISLLPPIAGG